MTLGYFERIHQARNPDTLPNWHVGTVDGTNGLAFEMGQGQAFLLQCSAAVIVGAYSTEALAGTGDEVPGTDPQEYCALADYGRYLTGSYETHLLVTPINRGWLALEAPGGSDVAIRWRRVPGGPGTQIDGFGGPVAP